MINEICNRCKTTQYAPPFASTGPGLKLEVATTYLLIQSELVEEKEGRYTHVTYSLSFFVCFTSGSRPKRPTSVSFATSAREALVEKAYMITKVYKEQR